VAIGRHRSAADRFGLLDRYLPANLESLALTSPAGVLSVGDLDVDFYIAVPTIPGFDQKVAGRDLGHKPGGMAANFAVALARLGQKARLIAAVGDDPIGQQVLAQLSREGVELGFVSRRNGVKSFTCVILLSPSGEKSLIKLESEAYLPGIEDLQPSAFDGIRHVHATYGSPELTAKAFEMASKRGLTTSLDLEPPDLRQAPGPLLGILPLVDMLFVNGQAYSMASDLLRTALRPGLLKQRGEIVVTLGAEGCRSIGPDGVMEEPGFKIRPVDTTGAGDCFAAAYVTSRLDDGTIRDSLKFANAAAALATLDFGSQTAMPNRQAVEAFMSGSGYLSDMEGHINA
jgi:ribokinase